MPFPPSTALRVEAAAKAVFPCSLTADWTQVAPYGSGITLATAAVLGASGPIPEDANYATVNTQPFKREGGMGTTLRFRMVYDNAHSSISALQYMLLGRRSTWATSNKNAATEGGATAWQVLPNRKGEVASWLSPNAVNDVKYTSGSATLRATNPDPLVNYHDNDGCNEFWLIPLVPITAAGGNVALARVEAKAT